MLFFLLGSVSARACVGVCVCVCVNQRHATLFKLFNASVFALINVPVKICSTSPKFIFRLLKSLITKEHGTAAAAAAAAVRPFPNSDMETQHRRPHCSVWP